MSYEKFTYTDVLSKYGIKTTFEATIKEMVRGGATRRFYININNVGLFWIEWRVNDYNDNVELVRLELTTVKGHNIKSWNRVEFEHMLNEWNTMVDIHETRINNLRKLSEKI